MTRRSAAGPGRRGRPGLPARHAPRQVPPEVAFNRRPFAGWPGEADLVALREVVPSASAPLTLADGSGRSVTLGTVLPMAWSAMVRADGSVVLALQTQQRSGDLSRDLGQALAAALEHETSAGITGLPLPTAEAPALQDLVVAEPLAVTVHSGFDWWLEGATDDLDPEVAESMAQANASVVPTVRLEQVEAAYWCQIGERCHLRWAMTEDEDALFDALARLHVQRSLQLGEGSKYVGSFRAHGILVPVWDLPGGSDAASVEEPATQFRERLQAALATPGPLSSDERRAKAGVVSRQITLR